MSEEKMNEFSRDIRELIQIIQLVPRDKMGEAIATVKGVALGYAGRCS